MLLRSSTVSDDKLSAVNGAVVSAITHGTEYMPTAPTSNAPTTAFLIPFIVRSSIKRLATTNQRPVRPAVSKSLKLHRPRDTTKSPRAHKKELRNIATPRNPLAKSGSFQSRNVLPLRLDAHPNSLWTSLIL